MRKRRAAVARSARRRRTWVLVGLVGLSALVAGGWVSLHSSILSARVVTVVGDAHAPEAAVVAASGLENHPPLIDVNTGAAAAGVERLPWVAHATVVPHWPDGVVITVQPAKAVAAVPRVVPPAPAPTPTGPSSTDVSPPGAVPSQTTGPAGATPPGAAGTSTGVTRGSSAAPAGAAWTEVDASGRVLQDLASPQPGLVQLTLGLDPGPPGRSLPPSAAPALRVAATLPPAFAAQVASITTSRGGQLTLKLTSPLTVVLGSAAQLKQKYEDVAALLAHAPLPNGAVLDVSVPESPTVDSG